MQWLEWINRSIYWHKQSGTAGASVIYGAIKHFYYLHGLVSHQDVQLIGKV